MADSRRVIPTVPALGVIGRAIGDALHLLPYRPQLLAAEPGRFLVAEAGTLATKIIGREERRGENWLFVEVGAYHGLGEVLPHPAAGGTRLGRARAWLGTGAIHADRADV